MKGMIRKCAMCGEYTLSEETCPHCGGNLKSPHPARFSPDDKYSKYRLALKLKNREEGQRT